MIVCTSGTDIGSMSAFNNERPMYSSYSCQSQVWIRQHQHDSCQSARESAYRAAETPDIGRFAPARTEGDFGGTQRRALD